MEYVQKVPLDKDKCLIYFGLHDYTNMFLTVTNSQKCFTYIILNVTFLYKTPRIADPSGHAV